jgi:serine/threonine protein phosphatase 1
MEKPLSTKASDSRLIAIGDIHGHSRALAALLAKINPGESDTIVTLGDYVDRGPDSKGVLDQLIDLSSRCRLVPLLGNHDEMMLGAREGKSDLAFWLKCGGGAVALDSYGDTGKLDQVPADHFRFLAQCHDYFETENHIFVHANYDPARPMDRQDSVTRLWLFLSESLPGPHCSGKIVVVGHTPQPTGQILDLGYIKCLDTGCGQDGCLTALDLNSGQTWQVGQDGD